jgi:hypothetical protein
MKYNKERGIEERYYGADLNKFIAENCRKDMTVINIDLMTWDRDKKHIKIIESKHLTESTGKGQLMLLKMLSKLFKLISGYTIEVIIVRGNPPYNWAYLEDVMTGERKKLKRQELIDYFNYEA